ncbi:MAG: hypothetical protein ABIF17_01975 [Patescibacteria group bacterium]
METATKHEDVLETELTKEKLNLLKTDKLGVTTSRGEFLGKMTLKEMMELAEENYENRS